MGRGYILPRSDTFQDHHNFGNLDNQDPFLVIKAGGISCVIGYKGSSVSILNINGQWHC